MQAPTPFRSRYPRRIQAWALLLLAVGLAGCFLPQRDLAPAATPGVETPLPLDPAVRTGRLANGLTWYVRENAKPEERAELWLVVNAGSVLEDEDQQGLAHFVEHMAFNGTRRFERQELVDYLESIGMRFGPDLNASTGFDETVYTLTVPTDDPAILGRAFDILEDWSEGITFDPAEIERERGVVIEEWRQGRGASARIRDRQLPVLFRGSRYAERLPIGRVEVLEQAPREALQRFYRDWYRPDLMAVIAVGDFDPAAIEDQIVRRFSGRLPPRAPRPRPATPVPDHDEPLWSVVTDPEATNTTVTVYQKLPARPDVTASDYRRSLVEQLYHGMLNARLEELRRSPEPPFLSGFSASGSFVRSTDVWVQAASVEDGGIERGLQALLAEVERVDRHGFAASELEREKTRLLRAYEQASRERDKRPSSTLAAEIQRHFLRGEAMPGIETELELVRELLPGIGIDDVNALARRWTGSRNRVVAVAAPDSAPVPGEEALARVFQDASKAGVEAWVDRVRDEPLVRTSPTPGRVIERGEVPEIGVHGWRLSNGIQVILKPTDFKNDELLLSGFSPGGTSLVPDERFVSASYAVPILRESGLGAFDRTELSKALAGKLASASPWISETEEGIDAAASPQDAETMFQLVYLWFTAPRRDAQAFTSWRERNKASLEHRLARPEAAFADALQVALTQGHPRRKPPSPETLDEIELDAALAAYRERFADAGDFTFVLVGNFEPAKIEPLIATWLGGLPAAGREETWLDVGVDAPDGVVQVEVRQGIEPKASVRIVFHGDTPWTRERQHDIGALADALAIRLREILREDLGGTYGVSVSGGISRRPRERHTFTIGFGCDPERVDALVRAVFDEIERVKRDGLDASYAAKVAEAERRQRETDLKQNGFWSGILGSYWRYGMDPRLILAYDELVARVTPANLAASARRWLDTSRYVRGTLLPDEDDPLASR